MIHYVVAVGKPDVIAPLAPLLSRAIRATTCFDGEPYENVAPDRPWMLAANALPDVFSESRIATDRDSMVVFNGEALALSDEQASLPNVLLRVFGSRGAQGVVDTLGGSYNFVGIHPSVGLLAFPDFSGLTPLYWSNSRDGVVVSNRATTIAHVTRSKGWALRPLAWTIGHGNLFGAEMPARGVSYVPPGQQLQVDWGTGSARINAAPTWSWPEPGSGDGRPNLSPDEWDGIVASLVDTFTAQQQLMGDLTLRLTGGKDSRLCLAIAKAAGLEQSIHTFTTGPPESPEVKMAKIVAKTAGFEHRRPRPSRSVTRRDPALPPRSPDRAPAVAVATDRGKARDSHGPEPGADFDATWRLLRKNVYRYEGTVNAWSGLGTSPRQALDVMGWGGELYRRGHSEPLQFPNLTVDQLAELFIDYHQPHDPLGLLQPEEAEYQREWMQAWVRENAEHVRVDFLPEKFYVDHRLSHWSGAMLQAAPLRLVVNPLLTAAVAKKVLELSAAARCEERFHFEVMRRAAPELVSIPFFNDEWRPGIVDPEGAKRAEQTPTAPTAPTASTTPGAARPRRTLKARFRSAGGSAVRSVYPAWRSSRRPATRSRPAPTGPERIRPPTTNPGQLLLAGDRKGIEALFHRAKRSTDMEQICDMDRLIDVTRQPGDLKSAAVREVFGCIGVALTLLGESEQVRDRPR